jgi:hypothetical protein
VLRSVFFSFPPLRHSFFLPHTYAHFFSSGTPPPLSTLSAQVDKLSKEPADEDLRRELRSALKARQENEALRDHIEHLKNGEVDMGLEASKRMSELSSEYMQQVDLLTREKEAVRARAEAGLYSC